MSLKSTKLISRIFANDFFKNLDKEKILERKNYSSPITLANANFKSVITSKPIPQLCNKIKYIPPEGIIINKPGNYILDCNIKWNGKYTGVAITIETDNVSINLNNKFIKNNYNNKHVKTVGIQSIGNNNITISNGCMIKSSCSISSSIKSVRD